MKNIKLLIPNIFTSLSLTSAFISLVYSSNDEFVLSSLFIFLSMIFDFLDGFSARKLNAVTPFGSLFDSMSDFVAFGIAPGLLIYRVSLININIYGIFITGIYIIGGCYRLIRFTLRSNDINKRKLFIGLPIPIAAGFLSSFVVINFRFWQRVPNVYILAITTLLLSFLMISRIEYLTVDDNGKLSLKSKGLIISFLISILVFFRYADLVLISWIILYIIYNPIVYFFSKQLISLKTKLKK